MATCLGMCTHATWPRFTGMNPGLWHEWFMRGVVKCFITWPTECSGHMCMVCEAPCVHWRRSQVAAIGRWATSHVSMINHAKHIHEGISCYGWMRGGQICLCMAYYNVHSTMVLTSMQLMAFQAPS